MDVEKVLISLEARVAVLEVLTCTALAEADADLAKRLEERFREVAEQQISHLSDQTKMGAAGLALSIRLAREIAAVEGRDG